MSGKAFGDARVSEKSGVGNRGKTEIKTEIKTVLRPTEHQEFYTAYFEGDTKAQTNATAIRKSLEILKNGGMMSLCIYSGGGMG